MAVLLRVALFCMYCCPVSIHKRGEKRITYYRRINLMNKCNGRTSLLPIVAKRKELT